jgi:hypothetical protein
VERETHLVADDAALDLDGVVVRGAEEVGVGGGASRLAVGRRRAGSKVGSVDLLRNGLR